MFKAPIPTNNLEQGCPWMNWALIAGNAIVFAAQTVRPGILTRYMLDARALEVRQFLTYGFLHISVGHLVCNMVVLGILGGAINRRLGQAGYLAFYLAGAVCAGVGFIVAGGEMMVGASGAVGAVMGAYLAFLPTSRIRVWLGIAVLEVRSTYVIVLFFIYNVLMSLIQRMELQQVAYEAHVAGMTFGFVVAVGLLGCSLTRSNSVDLLSLLRQRGRQSRQAD